MGQIVNGQVLDAREFLGLIRQLRGLACGLDEKDVRPRHLAGILSDRLAEQVVEQCR